MAKLETQRVPGKDLRVGDVFADDGDVITEVYRDSDGTWIETDRGDCGYADGDFWEVQLPRPPR